MNRVLVVAVHPDDETLGCGGTLLKHKDNGDEIHWLIATDVKESEGYDRKIVEKREDEIINVSRFFDFDSVNRLGLSTTKVDIYSMSELIKKISSIIKESLKSFELDDFKIENSLSVPLKVARENFEKDYLTTQLKKFAGNISKTAKFVGMERSALHRKLKSLGIKGLN